MYVRTTFLTLAAAAAFAGFPALVSAADAPATPAATTATEKAFVDEISADLNARFATIDAARAAGYIRYTDEDETGAISYANRQWTSADTKHPSQLWYDAKGRLIGADYSVPYTADRPNLFGIDPSRWSRFGAHVHYGLAGPNGTIYGGVGPKTLAKTNGSVDHPTASTLVDAGIAKKASDVRFVFAFPQIWDVSVWVIPNANGPFADMNPDVKPTKTTPMKM